MGASHNWHQLYWWNHLPCHPEPRILVAFGLDAHYALMCCLVIHFIFKLVKSRWKRLFWVVVLLGGSFLFRMLPIPSGLRISLGYVITAATILVPIAWYLVRTKGRNIVFVIVSFVIFGVAIFFRSIDLHQNFFPMGTHWLWHLLGGIAVHFLIAYIFKDNLLNLSANSVSNHD